MGAAVPVIVGFALALALADALADADGLALADLCGLWRPFSQP